jgi:uncharacterized membrane protein
VQPIKVLIAGESWLTSATHYKGWDFFVSNTMHSGVNHLRSALMQQDIEVTYLPSHEAAAAFPLKLEDLRTYQAIILSDIGSNTLLLHPDTWLHSRPMPNRLRLLRDYVCAGGGLAMIGGYYSFQGIYGAARYHGTPVEEVLPVEIQPWDDRVEVPEGFTARIILPEHPIVRSIPGEWPLLLGYNQVKARIDASVVATCGNNNPLLVVRHVGDGRTLAWTSDIGPHWCPEDFLNWSGFPLLWGQAVRWLADRL